MRRIEASLRYAVPALLLATACSDGVVTGRTDAPTPGGPGAKPVNVTEIACVGDRSRLTVRCGSPAIGASGDIIVGSQNVYVKLTSSNVAYNSGTGQFTFDVTVQNLIEQPMGTTDGTTLDPSGVRVFFHSGPTVTGGTGVASVVPDGFATFTAAGQPYYQYNEVLDQNEVSAADAWTLIMPPTVTTFAFLLYVSAPVQYPDGYITLNGMLPGAVAGDLHPGSVSAVTAVVKTHVGNVVPGAVVTFGTSNAGCATVTPTGSLTADVTGVQSAQCSITASAGLRSGGLVYDVTGAVRTWDGSASTDWSNGANWVGDLAPVAADSVLIPFGTPNSPILVANTTIGGVDVADAQTLSVAGFDLTANANVSTGNSGGILGTTGRLLLAGTSGTVQGVVPSTLVTGSYSLSQTLTATAVAQVDAGLLSSDLFELIVASQ